ncbi:MAG: hypothetical protein AAFX52_10710 [Pseudomonadota bacterium]
MSKRLVFSCGFALLASSFASSSHAQAAGWRLNPALCPDLREDIRDSRVTWSRRDLREDIRDRSVTNCPASAYTYVAPAAVHVTAVPVRPYGAVPVRPVYTGVYVAPRARYRAVPRVRVNVRVH